MDAFSEVKRPAITLVGLDHAFAIGIFRGMLVVKDGLLAIKNISGSDFGRFIDGSDIACSIWSLWSLN